MTYLELWNRTSLIANYLRYEVNKKSRVLLLYPQGLEFLTAFLGCLNADMIAVPAYPPKGNQKMSRLQAIIKNCQPDVILTTSSLLEKVKSKLGQIIDSNQIKCICTDQLGTISEELADNLTIDNEIAFLEYTSGSTGNPKGVIVSHENILHNSAYIQTAFQLTEESVSVTWLPSFHDMGLIDGIIQPLYTGFLGVIMSPQAFLQKPIRWLEAISYYRATHSGGTNLGYDLCVEKVTNEQIRNLNLSCWLSAYNGSEPIQYKTLERFINKFQSCGFKSHYFYPCYGMAESTLMVSGGELEKEPICLNLDAEQLAKNIICEGNGNSTKVKELVGCGHSWLDTDIQIVNPETETICEDNQIGEVWVSGSSIAQGYWQQSEVNTAVFSNKIDSLNGCYLRTGDLGFIRNQELFITGRIKDLIIIWGKNYYPQDIENTVQNCHPALRKDGAAAFSLEVDNQERLVIVQEVERTYLRNLDTNEVVKAIREAVSLEYELQVYAIALIKPASIAKTSSGKIQRYACRDQYITQTLSLVGEWQQKLTTNELIKDSNLEITEDNIINWLLTKLTGILGLEEDELEIETSFSEYGLDSSVALTLTGELGELLEMELEPTLFWEYTNIDELTEYLWEEWENDQD
ncbi:AMP-binding protein [Crocosphaera watsonii]|uniref:AMP-binding protein n=1 Tax=Crocosphaera watsonii TaxID=263511 RepID=UPI0009E1CDF2|nr:AMP-binding protein [Crocosphaera watsonii]